MSRLLLHVLTFILLLNLPSQLNANTTPKERPTIEAILYDLQMFNNNEVLLKELISFGIQRIKWCTNSTSTEALKTIKPVFELLSLSPDLLDSIQVQGDIPVVHEFAHLLGGDPKSKIYKQYVAEWMSMNCRNLNETSKILNSAPKNTNPQLVEELVRDVLKLLPEHYLLHKYSKEGKSLKFSKFSRSLFYFRPVHIKIIQSYDAFMANLSSAAMDYLVKLLWTGFSEPQNQNGAIQSVPTLSMATLKNWLALIYVPLSLHVTQATCTVFTQQDRPPVLVDQLKLIPIPDFLVGPIHDFHGFKGFISSQIVNSTTMTAFWQVNLALASRFKFECDRKDKNTYYQNRLKNEKLPDLLLEKIDQLRQKQLFSYLKSIIKEAGFDVQNERVASKVQLVLPKSENGTHKWYHNPYVRGLTGLLAIVAVISFIADLQKPNPTVPSSTTTAKSFIGALVENSFLVPIIITITCLAAAITVGVFYYYYHYLKKNPKTKTKNTMTKHTNSKLGPSTSSSSINGGTPKPTSRLKSTIKSKVVGHQPSTLMMSTSPSVPKRFVSWFSKIKTLKTKTTDQQPTPSPEPKSSAGLSATLKVTKSAAELKQKTASKIVFATK